MKSALHDEWTEDKVVLRRCILKGAVDFSDIRRLVADLVELWPSIRPYIRCTGLPHAKDTVDTVSGVVLLFSFFFFLLSYFLFFVVWEFWETIRVCLVERHRLEYHCR